MVGCSRSPEAVGHESQLAAALAAGGVASPRLQPPHRVDGFLSADCRNAMSARAAHQAPCPSRAAVSLAAQRPAAPP